MSFSFAPVLDQKPKYQLLENGIYEFEVKRVDFLTSKKGNPMMKLSLAIWDKTGDLHWVTCYLTEAMLYLLKHFCDSVGIEDKYELGKIESIDVLNKTGRCKIKIEKSEGYPEKNVVEDFLRSTPKQDPNFVSDDLPF